MGRRNKRERERDPSIYTLVAKEAATIALYKVFPRLAVMRSLHETTMPFRTSPPV